MPGLTKAQRNNEAKANRAIVRKAYADPSTTCCECGQTLDRCGPRRDGRNANGTPCTWDAGHPDGRWLSDECRPECSACNRRRGAADGNRTRGLFTTRRW